MRLGTLVAALTLVFAAFTPVVGAQPGTAAPDIEVTDVGWDQLVLDEPTTFTATVHNGGDEAREEPFDVVVSLEDAGFEQTVTVDQLNASETVTVSTPEPWTANTGRYTVNATADVDEGGTLDENRNANNHRNRSFAIGPDLTLHEIRLDPSTPIEGQDVQVSAKIENVARRGEHDIQTPFTVSFDIEEAGITLTTDPIQQLRPNDPVWVQAHETWTPEEGSYTVNAEADPDGNVTEISEDNNTAQRAVTVKAAQPDLVLTDVSPSQRPAPGDEVAVQATIENQGTADVTDGFDVRFRINGTTHGPDVAAGIDEDGLQPGENVTVSSQAWTASEGSHPLRAIADPAENVTESRSGNNERVRTVHVGPDLVVSDVLWTPDPTAVRHETSVEARVLNQGTVDVTETTSLDVEIPDEVSFSADVNPLGAGDSVQLTVGTWEAPTENTTYPVEARADADEDASEIDEDNNLREEQMIVTEARPDLVTSDVRLDPPTPASGEDARIEATIENNGSAAPEEDIEVEFRVDGEPVGEPGTIDNGPVEEFGPGSSTTVTSDAWTTTTGVHEVSVHADPEGNETEIREDNNEATREEAIGPDARLADIDRSPEDADVGETVNVDVVVANAGTETIDDVPVDVLVDGEPVGNATAEQLEPGANATVSVPWASTEGDHTVRAVADPGGLVSEAREDNNAREESFSATASADLQATAIRSSDDPRTGDKLRFTARVANTGTAPVEGSFTTTFHVDDEPIGAVELDGMGVGNSTTAVSDTWTAEPGSHTVRVVVDADDAVREEDGEDDNERTTQIRVAEPDGDQPTRSGPVNLTVSGISVPDPIAPGDAVTFLATIGNEGGQQAPVTEARILIDGEAVGQPEVDELGAGQRISVTSDTWNATRGEHTITVIADVLDDADESDEGDNERVKRIQVGNATSPDEGNEADGGLSLGPVSTTEPVQAGQTTRPTVEATNRGPDPVDVTVTFYIDGSQLGEASLVGLESGQTATLEGPDWEPTPGEHTITARADDAQAETLVDAGEATDDAPAPGLTALIAALAAAGFLRRRW